jgi:cytochrome c-type biogenesis protein CcmE
MKSLFQLSLLLFAVSMHVVLGQDSPRKIIGIVQDAESHQALPGAYIRVVGVNKGTISNADGAYRLLLPSGTYQIVVSYLGYLPDTLRLAITDHGVMHDFDLHPSPIILSEVLVVGDQSNPAEEVIKRAIERKKRLRARMGSYEYAAYTKMTMRIKIFRRVKDSLATGEVKTVDRKSVV